MNSGDKVMYNGVVYDFGYYTENDRCVIYEEGCRNMQDSISVPLKKLSYPDATVYEKMANLIDRMEGVMVEDLYYMFRDFELDGNSCDSYEGKLIPRCEDVQAMSDKMKSMLRQRANHLRSNGLDNYQKTLHVESHQVHDEASANYFKLCLQLAKEAGYTMVIDNWAVGAYDSFDIDEMIEMTNNKLKDYEDELPF